MIEHCKQSMDNVHTLLLSILFNFDMLFSESHRIASSTRREKRTSDTHRNKCHLSITTLFNEIGGNSGGLAAKARINVIGAVSRAKMPSRNITSKELKALKELANDKDILILPAEKGRATVVMDRTDYDERMQQMLSEESTYQLIENGPTPSLERKINGQLMSLKQSGQLPSEVYAHLRSSAGRVPLL